MTTVRTHRSPNRPDPRLFISCSVNIGLKLNGLATFIKEESNHESLAMTSPSGGILRETMGSLINSHATLQLPSPTLLHSKIFLLILRPASMENRNATPLFDVDFPNIVSASLTVVDALTLSFLGSGSRKILLSLLNELTLCSKTVTSQAAARVGSLRVTPSCKMKPPFPLISPSQI